MSGQFAIGQRTDISRYLFHWTTKAGFWSILRDGFFIATSAWRLANIDEGFPTIRGSRPAVCFGDVSVGNYLQSSLAQPVRYQRWGIAVLKDRLHQYGARPVFYADSVLITDLVERWRGSNRDERYLLAHYEPGDSDWMHEREWRVVSNAEVNQKIGLSMEGTLKRIIRDDEHTVSNNSLVPVHLPDVDRNVALPDEPEFVLLVDTEADIEELSKKQRGERTVDRLFRTRKDCEAMRGYRDRYLEAFSKAKTVSFERVKDGRDREGLWRLEDYLATRREPVGIEALWNRASVKGRREALQAAGVTGEKDYHYRRWQELQPTNPFLPGLGEAIEHSEDAIQVLRDDVRRWVETLSPDPM